MPIYKDKKTKKYIVRVNFTNKEGKSTAIYGSANTLSQAKDKYQELYAKRFYQTKLTLQELIEFYLADYKIKNKISSYFSVCAKITTIKRTMQTNIRIDKITPFLIRHWQNQLLKMDYSKIYVNSLNWQLKTILNYGVNYYNLKENPFKKVDDIGESYYKEKSFFTFEQFQLFVSAIDKKKNISCWVVFNLLFYTGARIGEIMALYPNDIDFKNKCIHIQKTYNKFNGKEYLMTPKTKTSIRDVKIPTFLCDILAEYLDKMPSLKLRLFFNINQGTLMKVKKEACKKAGLPYIRIHDLRHSAISYLISQNVPILEISKRMGHSSPAITYKVYAHLYADRDKKIADAINKDFEIKDLL